MSPAAKSSAAERKAGELLEEKEKATGGQPYRSGHNMMGRRVGRYRPQSVRSQRSLAFASAIVCHCKFDTASGPPQASALIWSFR